ncbi:hypothetical protein LR961_06540 [Stenotrophomonas sp. SY1]|nr:hypothetical protein [Stenotrophomonas sp. SY1]
MAMLAQRMRVDMFPQKVAIGRSDERLAGCVGWVDADQCQMFVRHRLPLYRPAWLTAIGSAEQCSVEASPVKPDAEHGSALPVLYCGHEKTRFRGFLRS